VLSASDPGTTQRIAAGCAMLLDPNKQITKLTRCPDCWADMDFLGAQLNERVFLSTILERHFFVCPDCGHLGYEIVLRPKEFIRFEAPRFSQIDHTAC
jgi:uncharacterized protein with PIN domain